MKRDVTDALLIGAVVAGAALLSMRTGISVFRTEESAPEVKHG